ncbi:MAG: PBP1A family penicillin-binding protein [Patescibacteria group bacterium]|jgi:1A family penicillin-binding protein
MPIPQLSHRYAMSWRHHSSPAERPASESSTPKPKSTRRRWLRRLLVVAVILIGIGLIGAVGAFAWYSRDLPNPDKLLTRNLAQSTRIYDRTGQTVLYEIHGDEKRTQINLEDIPDNLKNATITTEDRNFYKHGGISWTGIIRSVVRDVFSGKKSQGGSTITQQFIKNAILTSEKSYTRKIKEVVLAYQIEKRFSKDQILKMYFNEIPYGSVAYGVESAAQTYFGKNARDLTLAESAVLAALPQSPTYYSPYGSHVDELIGRQKYILDQMAELGYITQDQAAEAKNAPITFRTQQASIAAPHFVMYVKELLTQKYGEKMVEQGGLKVITTLDIDKQKVAEEEITKGMDKVKKYGGSNAALVSADTKTGQILAMVGSADYFDTANDGNVNVAIRDRQPGSSFKPVAYLTAFTRGYTPETMLFDVKTNFGGDPAYIPSNYDGKEHGPVSMRQALAGSLNIPAVKTLYLAGINNTLDMAHQLGYTTLNDRERYGLSLVLGGGEVKLLDHVGAYATFAREGVRHPMTAVLSVEDKDGKMLEQFKPEENQVYDEQSGRKLNSVLSDNAARSFIFGGRNSLTLSDRQVAAKTGTTNDYRDAWTLGYTPSIVTGVWAGNNDNTVMKKGADGSVVAAPIWHGYMERVLKGTIAETFKTPTADPIKKTMLGGQIDQVTTYKVDKITKRIVPDSCLKQYPADYIATRTFKEAHTILYYVDKDKPRGDVPKNPAADPQFQTWEAGVQAWANGQPDYITAQHALPYESCDLRKGGTPQPLGVTLTAPANNARVTTSPLTITVQIGADVSVDTVTIFIDDTQITSLTAAPYTYNYDISGKPNGFYTIRASVKDKNGTVTDQTATINLLLSSDSSSYSFSTPTNNQSVSVSGFPLTISGSAASPKGIKELKLYAQQSGSEAVLIQSGIVVTNGTFSTTWPTAAAAGSYRLYLVATLNDDTSEESDSIQITLTP